MLVESTLELVIKGFLTITTLGIATLYIAYIFSNKDLD